MQKIDKDIFFDIPVKISSVQEKKIAEVFFAFDHSAVNMVQAKDVGTILRIIGFTPTEAEVQDVVSKTEFQDHPGNVHLSKFLPFIKKVINEKKLKPSTSETLLRAFRLFDNENKGYIEMKTFVTVMKTTGDVLDDEELKEMMKAAVDPSTKRIHYENYIAKLLHEPEILKSEDENC